LAEIIPLLPEPDNAGVGKRSSKNVLTPTFTYHSFRLL